MRISKGDLTSPVETEDAASAAEDVLASPKSWICDTTQLFKSDLAGIETVGKRGRNQVRLTSFIFNIMCKTATTKEAIIDHIRLEFNDKIESMEIFIIVISFEFPVHRNLPSHDKIQHICMELDLQSTSVKRQLYIQITCIFEG
ncbi:unnamed protein product, partial [Rotaria magnacalcarata]